MLPTLRPMAASAFRAAARQPLVPAVVLAASTVALLPTLRPSYARTAGSPGDRFFVSRSSRDDDDDDELRRLRRENAELRDRLRSSRERYDDDSSSSGIWSLFSPRRAEQDKGSSPSSSGGGVVDVIKGLFGRKEETALEKNQRALNREIDEALRGTGLLGGVLGSLAKGVAGMGMRAFAETAADVDRVQEAVARRLERDGTLGGNGAIESDAPMQQAYSSSSINGRVTKSVQLAYRVTNARTGLSGVVRVEAAIDGAGNVDIVDLSFDDRGSGPSSGRRGGSRRLESLRNDGTVIDV